MQEHRKVVENRQLKMQVKFPQVILYCHRRQGCDRTSTWNSHKLPNHKQKELDAELTNNYIL